MSVFCSPGHTPAPLKVPPARCGLIKSSHSHGASRLDGGRGALLFCTITGNQKHVLMYVFNLTMPFKVSFSFLYLQFLAFLEDSRFSKVKRCLLLGRKVRTNLDSILKSRDITLPTKVCLISSVQFSHSVVSDSLRPHESQHARPPCPSPTPGVHSDSHPSSQ